MPGTDLEPKAKEIAAAIVSGKLTPDQAAAQMGVDVALVNRWTALYVAATRAAFEERAKAVLGRARSQTLIGGAGMMNGAPIAGAPFGRNTFGGVATHAAGTLGNWPAAPQQAPAQAQSAPWAAGVQHNFGTTPNVAAAGQNSIGAQRMTSTLGTAQGRSATPPAGATGTSSTPKAVLPQQKSAGLPPSVSAAPSVAPLLGKLDNDTLREITQLIAKEKRSGVLTINSPPDVGNLHFEQGVIIHADYRGLRGQDAIWKLLDVQHGSFDLKPPRPIKERTVRLDTSALLDEADRRRSEARGLKKRLGSARQVFVLGELSKEQRLWLRPIDHQLVALFDGKRSVKQVVQKALFDEFTTLNQVAQLLDKGLLIPASLRPMVVDVTPQRIALSDSAMAALVAIPSPHPRRHWGRWAMGGVVVVAGITGGLLVPPQTRQLAIEWQGAAHDLGARSQLRVAQWLASRSQSQAVFPHHSSANDAAAAAALAVGDQGQPSSHAQSSAICPDGSVWIGPGSFRMGSNNEDQNLSHARPEHVATVSDGYCIDRFEVTVKQYNQCVEDKRCSPASTVASWPRGKTPERDWIASRTRHSDQCNAATTNRSSHPVNCISWEQANAYCTAQGGRLPTETEWEFAARGNESRTYPWGERVPNPELLNGCGTECELWHQSVGLSAQVTSTLHGADDGFTGTAPVGSFPDGQTPQGVHDLAGNVAEWTADELYAYPATGPGGTRPQGGQAKEAHTIRGGSFTSNQPLIASAASRGAVSNATLAHDIGFRCVR